MLNLSRPPVDFEMVVCLKKSFSAEIGRGYADLIIKFILADNFQKSRRNYYAQNGYKKYPIYVLTSFEVPADKELRGRPCFCAFLVMVRRSGGRISNLRFYCSVLVSFEYPPVPFYGSSEQAQGFSDFFRALTVFYEVGYMQLGGLT